MARPQPAKSYIVRGHWPFPTDMLRHDMSTAASDADQAIIDGLSGEHASDRGDFVDRDILLVGPCKPNTARWESFGWSVPTDTDHAMLKRWRQEALAEAQAVEDALAKLTDEERALIEARMNSGRS